MFPTHDYPYTNAHEMNLDWVIAQIKKLTGEMNDFIITNQIHFEGLHDMNKEYRAFSIVDTPSHTGYISIKPVPTNITIDNEDYWRQIANYSELYADMQNRIVDLEQNVSNIKDTLSNIKDRVIILIGDSYVQGVGGDGNDIKNYLESHINCTVYPHLASGGGFFAQNAQGQTFNVALDNAINDTPINLDTVTDVVIVGGINDIGYSGSKNYIELLKSMQTKVNDNFKNAKLTICPTPYVNIAYGDNIKNEQLNAINGCIANGINCSRLATQWLQDYIGDDSYQSGDNLHPSHKGYEIIAGHVLMTMQGEDHLTRHYESYTDSTTGTTYQISTYGDDMIMVEGRITKPSGASFTMLPALPKWITWAPSQKVNVSPVSDSGTTLAPLFVSGPSNLWLSSGNLNTGTTYYFVLTLQRYR